MLAPDARPSRRRDGRLVVLLAALITALGAPALASDFGDPAQREQKTYWQNRYRDLLARQSELRATIERERELYADANRRNYRRGRKRHVHRDKMLAAEAELVGIESQLATFEDDARRAGALPGWLYEVEMELEDAEARPAIAAGPGDEGRNPLYLERTDGDRKPRDLERRDD